MPDGRTGVAQIRSRTSGVMARRVRPTLRTEHDVLVACRRRCCLCYFLLDDERVRKGQIAHLNRDRAHSDVDNLVYLCFDHHDEYDSITRQAKGLTELEVRTHRDALVALYAEAPVGNAGAARAGPVVLDPLLDIEDGRPPQRPWRFPLWLTADQPELFAYIAPGADGICAIERVDLPDGRIVIACIQVSGNPGKSITNGAEYVFAQVCGRFGLEASRVVWLEHYDYPRGGGWKQVRFPHAGIDSVPGEPSWTVVTDEGWADLRLAPMSRSVCTTTGDLRTKLRKRFPWPPVERALIMD